MFVYGIYLRENTADVAQSRYSGQAFLRASGHGAPSKCLGAVAVQKHRIIVSIKLYDKHMPVIDLLTTDRFIGVPTRHGNVSSAISEVSQTGSEFWNYAEA